LTDPVSAIELREEVRERQDVDGAESLAAWTEEWVK
jgi:hypothetical protein